MKSAQRTARRGVRMGWLGAGVAGLSLIGGVGGAALAQEGEKKQEAAPAAGGAPVLVIERAGLDRLLVDERDAGVARAMAMIPARLRELPRESPEFAEMPPAVVDMVLRMITRPGRLALTYNAQDQSGGGFGLGLIASVDLEGEEEAAQMQGTVAGLVATGGTPFQWAPSKKFEGMTETFAGVGTLRYGPREVGDEWKWEIHFGSVGSPDRAFGALPERKEIGGAAFTPVLRAVMDPAPLTPLLDMVRAFAGGQPGAEEGIAGLVEMGLIGPKAISYEYQIGYLPDRSVATWRMRGAKPYAAKLSLATEPLAESALAAVPADATVAWVGRFDLTNTIAQLRGAAESQPEFARGLEEFEAHTGVDLFEDFVGSLGDTAGLYFSDSTGGGKLGSAVAFMTLKDVEKFKAASTKLAAALDVMLQEEPEIKGRVRTRRWTDGATELRTLDVLGLPIPLELTWAVAGDKVIFGLTPQAAVAGARQATGRGDKGLGSNESFRAAMPRGVKYTAVSFVDTPRTMRAGYQYVSFAGSALANLVRSPFDPERDPGMVVPTYAELSKGARARVSFSAWEGEDLVQTAYGNRSILVDAAGVIGAAEPVFPVIGAMIGAAGASARDRQRW